MRHDTAMPSSGDPLTAGFHSQHKGTFCCRSEAMMPNSLSHKKGSVEKKPSIPHGRARALLMRREKGGLGKLNSLPEL